MVCVDSLSTRDEAECLIERIGKEEIIDEFGSPLKIRFADSDAQKSFKAHRSSLPPPPLPPPPLPPTTTRSFPLRPNLFPPSTTTTPPFTSATNSNSVASVTTRSYSYSREAPAYSSDSSGGGSGSGSGSMGRRGAPPRYAEVNLASSTSAMEEGFAASGRIGGSEISLAPTTIPRPFAPHDIVDFPLVRPRDTLVHSRSAGADQLRISSFARGPVGGDSGGWRSGWEVGEREGWDGKGEGGKGKGGGEGGRRITFGM